MTVTIHGTIMSPWVRRLLAFCEEKGVEYDIVNVVPFGEPDPEFLKISPLGKVPVMEVNGHFLPDSLAGCAYLESEIADPAFFPSDSWELGWMHWLCDYLGTGLFSKVEAPLFINRFVNPILRESNGNRQSAATIFCCGAPSMPAGPSSSCHGSKSGGASLRPTLLLGGSLLSFFSGSACNGHHAR